MGKLSTIIEELDDRLEAAREVLGSLEGTRAELSEFKALLEADAAEE